MIDLFSSSNLCYWEELLKFSNQQITAFDWKWSQLKKLPILPVSYQYIVNKVPTIWAKLLTYSRILYLFSSSNLCYWKELLKFSNLQIRAFDWKWSQLKKLPTLPINYQYIINKIPTIWIMLLTSPWELEFLSSLDICFWRNY